MRTLSIAAFVAALLVGVSSNAAAQTGGISGTMTDAVTTTGIVGATVQVYTSAGVPTTSAVTTAGGAYTIAGLAAGTYFARTFVTSSQNYIDELYDNIPAFLCVVTQGTPIVVTAGATHGGIDFALTPGGTISGTITDAVTTLGINLVSVSVTSPGLPFSKSASTNSAGVYSITGLPTGTFFARTFVSVGNYVDEAYDNIPCLTCSPTSVGTAIAVTAGAVHGGVDFALSAGASITGTVTDAVATTGITGVVVQVLTTTGTVKTAVTGAGGTYTVTGLPAGTYFARTSVGGSLNYIDEAWDNICLLCPPTFGQSGTPIPVAAGATVAGINFPLAVGGTITGALTDVVTTGAVTTGTVSINTAGFPAKTGFVDGTGHYTVTGLPTGTYYARTNSTFAFGYIDELFDNIPCPTTINCTITSGTPLNVTAGGAAQTANFALSKGGSISGTVTDSVTAAGVSGVNIFVFNLSGIFVNATQSGAGGTYTVSGLPATGTYFARATMPASLTYQDQLYNSLPCLNCSPTSGTPISVTAGSTTPGINFALVAGGSISGTVTDGGTGAGLGSVTLTAFSSSGASLKSASSATCPAGPYTITGLPTGSYFVRTSVNSLQNYVDELYDNIPCLNCSVTTGTSIAVTAGAAHTGVDFALAPGGIITGVVTDAGTTAALQSLTVQILTSNGSNAKTTSTSAAGVYSVLGLPSGVYYARTLVSSTLNYVDEVWNNVPCVNCLVTAVGNPITVTAGATQSGISFALSPGGTITGSVTDQGTTAALASVTVQVFTSTGASAKSVSSNGAGVYTVTGLPDGNYFARTAVSNTLNYVDEVWDNIPCLGCTVTTTGTAIAVTVGVIHGGINFALSGGGTITGSVTDAVSSAGLSGVNVQVYNSAGTSIKSVNTTGTGAYTIVGLPTGSYFARTFVSSSMNYVDELYNNFPCIPSCTITSGTAIGVVAGAISSGINLGLSPAGSISGTVTDAGTAAGVGFVSVQVFSSTGIFVKSTNSLLGSGAYTIGGLTTGSYFARTVVPSNVNYIDELYDNIPCFPSCTVTTGTPIAVTLGAAHSGVNFALSPGGIVSGTVSDSGTASGLLGITVQVFTSTGAFAKSVASGAAGAYSVMGLPTGTYFARTAVTPVQYYVDEAYNNVTCFNCSALVGNPIAVTAGANHSGVDFALSPGGAVSGLVTDAGTAAGLTLANVQVFTSTAVFVKSSNSGAGGAFAIGGLPPGTYFARTAVSAALNYIDEAFDNIPCVPCSVLTGAPIVVTAGATQTGINFALSPGGGFTGTVTDAGTAAPLQSVSVQVFTSTGAFLGSKSVNTASNGTFTILGLPNGNYFSRTVVPVTLNYVDELFNNIQCLGCSVTTGTPISVTVGPTPTAGVNFALAAGGTITGTVTDAATTAGLVSLQVSVFASGIQNPIKNVFTTTGGSYTATGLPAGTYILRTFVSSTQLYADQLYNNVPCCSLPGTPVNVTAGATTSGVNFALLAGGNISGSVTDAVTSAGLPATVQVFSSTGAFVTQSGTNTNAGGIYFVNGLAPGTYYARTIVGSTLYVDELWDNIPCGLGCVVTTGTPIVVTAGAAHSAVNFGLSSGGAISGTVSDAGTAAPLGGVRVSVYTSTGVLARNVNTSAGGGYLTGGLPAGSYFARTFVPASLNYVDELYDNIACGTCTVTTGTAISVTGGATHSGVNFGLAATTHPTPPSLVWGGAMRFSLTGVVEQWASTEAVAGRSYCTIAVPDKTAVSSQPYGSAERLLFATFRADGTTPLSSGAGQGFAGDCFETQNTETMFIKVKQSEGPTRQYRLQTVETTLWANWYFVGGNYSSYTLLRNADTFGDQIHATIRWRSDAGVVVSTESVTIPTGGTVFYDARGRTGSAIAGSVEITHDGAPGALVGSQTTLASDTGLSFDTILMLRVPR